LNSTIGIIACGWLGLPLARAFLAEGFKVNGSTTSEEKINTLKKVGVNPFWILLGENKIEGPINDFLKDVDVLIINVPPKLKGSIKDSYVKKMQLLHDTITGPAIKKVLFISSTSVYGNMDAEVTEDTQPKPVTESGKQVLTSEVIYQGDDELQTTIVRFGGLIGPNRHPVILLSGRKGLTNGNAPVNLIHREDCIHMIKAIIINEWWDEIFNGVYPLHPIKKEYYSAEAQKRGLPIPEYVDENGKIRGKIIKSKNFLYKKQRFKTSITN